MYVCVCDLHAPHMHLPPLQVLTWQVTFSGRSR